MATYQEEFKAFLQEFNERPVSGAEVGELIVKMSLYFSDYNLALVQAIRSFNRVAKQIETTVDEASGKAISSTKAKVLADATEEAHAYELARAHVQNLEQNLNSLKALQKGVLGEYARA